VLKIELEWLKEVAKIVDVYNKDEHYTKGRQTIRKYAYGDELLNKLGSIEAVIASLESKSKSVISFVADLDNIKESK